MRRAAELVSLALQDVADRNAEFVQAPVKFRPPRSRPLSRRAATSGQVAVNLRTGQRRMIKQMRRSRIDAKPAAILLRSAPHLLKHCC